MPTSEKTGIYTIGSILLKPKKKVNFVSWVAPLTGILSGYLIWRFLIGSPANFLKPDLSGGFWSAHEGPKWGFARKASGKRREQLFFQDLRYLLARDMMKADIDRDQKVMAIQKEMDEAASLELHAMEKNLVFLSTIASVSTLMGLLGTVIGMITSFC